MNYEIASRTRGPKHAALCAACLVALSGCHWDMWNNARYKPLEPTTFFADNATARTVPPGIVPYYDTESKVLSVASTEPPLTDTHYFQGKVEGAFAKTLPASVPLNRALIERGQRQFEIYCIPCHGKLGDGQGMITTRGFPNPPSYHIDRLRQVELGYFVDVMTNGFGRMYSYASRVKPEDRWAIASYIRVLQLSQNATPELLPADVLEQAKNPQPAAAEAHEGPQSNEHD